MAGRIDSLVLLPYEYIETACSESISVADVGNLLDYHRLFRLFAANTSQLLDLTNNANAIGVDVKTIKCCISILEASYIFFLLPLYFDNFGKRSKALKSILMTLGLCFTFRAFQMTKPLEELLGEMTAVFPSTQGKQIPYLENVEIINY